MTPDSPKRHHGVRYKLLADRLAQCPQVARYDTADSPESSTLAHAFLDLADSFQQFLTVHLPKLEDASMTPDQRYDVLLDIGDEFRHIMYHLQQPRFYRHYVDLEE